MKLNRLTLLIDRKLNKCAPYNNNSKQKPIIINTKVWRYGNTKYFSARKIGFIIKL